MGCHTWFYNKIDTPPYEEIKEVVIKVYQDNIDLFNKWIDNPLCDEYVEMCSVYTEYTIDKIKKWRDLNIRLVRIIKNNYCKKAVLNRYCIYNKDLIVNINGELYKNVKEYHDSFRKYGYPDDMLFSLEETIDYINNPNNECYLYDYSIKKISEFWDKYPNGMIDFG